MAALLTSPFLSARDEEPVALVLFGLEATDYMYLARASSVDMCDLRSRSTVSVQDVVEATLKQSPLWV